MFMYNTSGGVFLHTLSTLNFHFSHSTENTVSCNCWIIIRRNYCSIHHCRQYSSHFFNCINQNTQFVRTYGDILSLHSQCAVCACTLCKCHCICTVCMYKCCVCTSSMFCVHIRFRVCAHIRFRVCARACVHARARVCVWSMCVVFY